tara:strand:+ start:11771 stop:12688 length:918 start_codon:yes stop_codon:yes gene_type:complete
MNINSALKILKLENKYNYLNIKDLTQIELKRNYHVLALNNHPDKNNDINANKIFQEIEEAYSFLKNIIDNNKYNNYENDNSCTSDIEYTDLIISFVDILSKTMNTQEINKFHDKCIEYSNKLLDQLLDKVNINVLEDLYCFINNNTYFSDKISNNIKNIIINKLKIYNIYIINPTLDNLLNSEIFKLEISNNSINNIIYIPLWHNEMIYEKNIIKIQPKLPNNITIDDNNNIHIKYINDFENLISMIKIDISYLLIHNYKIPINELKFKKNQIYKLKNLGMPIVNNLDILDNKTKSDIYIHINLD